MGEGELKAILALVDGTIVEGVGFGSEGEAAGEVVFNTSMTGYEEALTDPSYKGQILMMTYPLIGNYGVRESNFESERIQVEGFIVREACKEPSHRDSVRTISQFLEEQGIPGISEVDTRMLTKKIRVYGVMNGALVVSSENIDPEYVLELARKRADISEIDLVPLVSPSGEIVHEARGDLSVVIIDCGCKLSIVRSLLRRNITVIRVPYDTPPEKILEYDPDGVLISNGPGDPKRVRETIETIRKLVGKVPLFGICLGNQLLALALGGDTYKLKFGHRGSNHPVKFLDTGKVYITSQNHGFAVDPKSLEGSGLEVWQVNLTDGSVEGLRHRELPIFSVQYHPEAFPGPWDTNFLFDEFARMIREHT